MTPDPASCTPETTVGEAATLMRDNDCGSIPVVENTTSNRLVGTVTDRDLAIRVLAAGRGPDVLVREAMTPDPVTCVPEDEVEDLREVMIAQQVRRVLPARMGRRATGKSAGSSRPYRSPGAI
jgi:CBS domain-containing protein